MTKPSSIDVEAYSLARHFLTPETPEGIVNNLAEHIQSAIEDWFKLTAMTPEEHSDG